MFTSALSAEIVPFLCIAVFTLLAGCAAFLLRGVIHSAILLTAAWAGIGAFYLWAGAQFVAFAQVLVYVGAISMVVLFAVLLTRRDEADEGGGEGGANAAADGARVALGTRVAFQRAVLGVCAAALTAFVLAAAVLATPLPVPAADAPAPALSVAETGALLMGPHAGALLAMGVLLTAALLGAVVLAAQDN
jgi:NADH:ubiquinone oxidoreductase subunit 6 (subunit J)